MKTRIAVVASLVAALAVGGCSILFPPTDTINRLPVVRYGETAPEGLAFVIYYPAGTSLPVVSEVGGTLFEQTGKAEMSVTLKRDVYVYRQWASFDGKTWRHSSDLIDSASEIKLPGVDNGKNPGSLSARFDLRGGGLGD